MTARAYLLDIIAIGPRHRIYEETYRLIHQGRRAP